MMPPCNVLYMCISAIKCHSCLVQSWQKGDCHFPPCATQILAAATKLGWCIFRLEVRLLPDSGLFLWVEIFMKRWIRSSELIFSWF